MSISIIQEVLLGLIGFTGDLIVERSQGGGFEVRPGLPHPSIQEQEQINRVVKLGWYYRELEAYCRQHTIQARAFILPGREQPQPYLVALCQGIQDLLTEYCDDISYLEQLSLMGDLPAVSMLTQHLQKYLIVFPEVHSICLDITQSNIKSCLIIDYLAHLNRGISILNDVIDRILLHVRVVFMKQCVSWMLLGDLDPDFFIQKTESGQTGKTNNTNNNSGSSSRDHTQESFDWNKTY